MSAEFAVVYIMGAGRSGSTLLDVALGNAQSAFSCGEIRKFPALRGEPHGFPPGSATYAFWQRVAARVAAAAAFDGGYRGWMRIAQRMESHAAFPASLAGLRRATERRAYARYVNAVFAAIAAESGAAWLIDSSKYPGRALAVHRHLEAPVYFVFLRRRWRGVIRSFGKRDVEQPAKNTVAASLYYFIMNAVCETVYRLLPEERRMRVSYESLTNDPERVLRDLGEKFGLDLEPAIARVAAGRGLAVGHLFEGNRIRLEREIKMRKSSSSK